MIHSWLTKCPSRRLSAAARRCHKAHKTAPHPPPRSTHRESLPVDVPCRSHAACREPIPEQRHGGPLPARAQLLKVGNHLWSIQAPCALCLQWMALCCLRQGLCCTLFCSAVTCTAQCAWACQLVCPRGSHGVQAAACGAPPPPPYRPVPLRAHPQPQAQLCCTHHALATESMALTLPTKSVYI